MTKVSGNGTHRRPDNIAPDRVFFKSDAITRAANCNPIREPMAIGGKFARRYSVVNCLFRSPTVQTVPAAAALPIRKKRDARTEFAGIALRSYRSKAARELVPRTDCFMFTAPPLSFTAHHNSSQASNWKSTCLYRRRFDSESCKATVTSNRLFVWNSPLEWIASRLLTTVSIQLSDIEFKSTFFSRGALKHYKVPFSVDGGLFFLPLNGENRAGPSRELND